MNIQTSSGPSTPLHTEPDLQSPSTSTWQWPSSIEQNNAVEKNTENFVVLKNSSLASSTNFSVGNKNSNEERQQSASTTPATKKSSGVARVHTSSGDPVVAERETTSPQTLQEPHAFTPKDLHALSKNLENEITLTEQSLNDENDKRAMFKVNVFPLFSPIYFNF